MRILVTGGAGFIGSHLCDALLEAGHSVVVIDDLSLGRRTNIAHQMGNPGFVFEEMDLLDRPALQRVFAEQRPEVVFHLAANSDIARGIADPEVDIRKTFLTTFEVLCALRKTGCHQLVFASTSAIYGEKDGALAEDSGPLRPISLYGAAKLSAEAYISAFGAGYGIQSWIYRFPNVVGERATHGAMYDFIARLQANPAELTILGDGQQTKPYLYVRDLVKGILFGWERSRETFNCFNLGVETSTNVTRLAEIVREEMGLPGAQLRYTGGDRGWVGDVPRFQYDLTRIHQLGWRAAHTSDEAVRLAVRNELQLRAGKS